MTLHIPISPEVEAKLRARAAELGTDMTGFVLQALSEKLGPQNGGSPSASARLEAWQRFVASMTEWGKNLPIGHIVDDSRESIYEGRGE